MQTLSLRVLAFPACNESIIGDKQQITGNESLKVTYRINTIWCKTLNIWGRMRTTSYCGFAEQAKVSRQDDPHRHTHYAIRTLSSIPNNIIRFSFLTIPLVLLPARHSPAGLECRSATFWCGTPLNADDPPLAGNAPHSRGFPYPASRTTYAKEGWRANCLYTANAYPYEVKTLKRVLFVTASLRPEAQYSELTTAHAK